MLLAVDGKGRLIPKPPTTPIVSSIGGPSPGERDNSGTESFPNQDVDGGGNAGGGGGGGHGGGGGGGGTTTTTANFVPPDPSAFLGIYGLPSDVQAKVASIFQNTGDVNQATALALAYIRGTPWYAQTYPGIQAGIANGTITNEAGYRSYLNQVNQLYQQYYGRSVTGDELAGYLGQGFNANRISQGLQGQAYVAANGNDVQYLAGAFGGTGRLTGDQLSAYGNEQAGLDTPLGQLQQKIIQKAQAIQQKVFSGTLASPSLSLGNNGLNSPSLAGIKGTPDVGA